MAFVRVKKGTYATEGHTFGQGYTEIDDDDPVLDQIRDQDLDWVTVEDDAPDGGVAEPWVHHPPFPTPAESPTLRIEDTQAKQAALQGPVPEEPNIDLSYERPVQAAPPQFVTGDTLGRATGSAGGALEGEPLSDEQKKKALSPEERAGQDQIQNPEGGEDEGDKPKKAVTTKK